MYKIWPGVFEAGAILLVPKSQVRSLESCPQHNTFMEQTCALSDSWLRDIFYEVSLPLELAPSFMICCSPRFGILQVRASSICWIRKCLHGCETVVRVWVGFDSPCWGRGIYYSLFLKSYVWPVCHGDVARINNMQMRNQYAIRRRNTRNITPQ